MCPARWEGEERRSGARQGAGCRTSSENGSAASLGPTGEPSPSGQHLVSMVRQHKGLSDISVSSLLVMDKCPATFTALKLDALDGYTVTLSFGLTSSQYGDLISMLEANASLDGDNVSVGVKFEPTTPNLVPQDTAPSI